MATKTQLGNPITVSLEQNHKHGLADWNERSEVNGIDVHVGKSGGAASNPL